MLVKSKNNSNENKDFLAIGQKEYKETNPFGHKDYKETYDNLGWWKTVEYIDESGEKVVKEINPLGQVLIHRCVDCIENEKKEIELDEAILDEWEFDDNQKEIKKEKYYDCEETPAIEPDENNLSENDFFRMDWKKSQYQIYRLLVNISSSLSNIMEVSKENEK